MAMIGWLAAFVILIGIEAGTMALTTIWFAGGALAAFFAALFGLSVQVQLVLFLAVSFVLLIFTKPFVSRFVNRKDQRGWADRKERKGDGPDRQCYVGRSGRGKRPGMDGPVCQRGDGDPGGRNGCDPGDPGSETDC